MRSPPERKARLAANFLVRGSVETDESAAFVAMHSSAMTHGLMLTPAEADALGDNLKAEAAAARDRGGD